MSVRRGRLSAIATAVVAVVCCGQNSVIAAGFTTSVNNGDSGSSGNAASGPDSVLHAPQFAHGSADVIDRRVADATAARAQVTRGADSKFESIQYIAASAVAASRAFEPALFRNSPERGLQLADLRSTSCAAGLVRCGAHGLCFDEVNTVTNATVPRCKCDNGWFGLDCGIDGSKVDARCFNGVLDVANGETDVDCGGHSCGACAEGFACKRRSDCVVSTIAPSSPSPIVTRAAAATAPSAARNVTLLCSTTRKICTAGQPRPEGRYLATTVRLANVLPTYLMGGDVAVEIHRVVLEQLLGRPARSDDELRSMTITRVEAFSSSTSGSSSRLLRRPDVEADDGMGTDSTAAAAAVLGGRRLSSAGVSGGIEVSVELMLNASWVHNGTLVVTNSTTGANGTTVNTTSIVDPGFASIDDLASNITGNLNVSLSSGTLSDALRGAVPGLPLISSSFSPSHPTMVQTMLARAAPEGLGNENDGGGNKGIEVSTIGGIIAATFMMLVLLPLAGLGLVTFMGERDANGHTWVDRSVIYYCPCCARKLYTKPITAAAPHGGGIKKGKGKGSKKSVVLNPAFALIEGDKGLSAAAAGTGEPKRADGATTAKEFLAQRKAQKEAQAAAAAHVLGQRPRAPSRGGSPGKTTNALAAGFQSPIGRGANNAGGAAAAAKRIGGAVPHGVLLDTVKPTVSNVVEIVKDTAKLGMEIGNAYDASKDIRAPSPSYGAAAGKTVARTAQDSVGFGSGGGAAATAAARSSIPSSSSPSGRMDFSPQASRMPAATGHSNGAGAAGGRGGRGGGIGAIGFLPPPSAGSGPGSASPPSAAVVPQPALPPATPLMPPSTSPVAAAVVAVSAPPPASLPTPAPPSIVPLSPSLTSASTPLLSLPIHGGAGSAPPTPTVRSLGAGVVGINAVGVGGTVAGYAYGRQGSQTGLLLGAPGVNIGIGVGMIPRPPTSGAGTPTAAALSASLSGLPMPPSPSTLSLVAAASAPPLASVSVGAGGIVSVGGIGAAIHGHGTPVFHASHATGIASGLPPLPPPPAAAIDRSASMSGSVPLSSSYLALQHHAQLHNGGGIHSSGGAGSNRSLVASVAGSDHGQYYQQQPPTQVYINASAYTQPLEPAAALPPPPPPPPAGSGSVSGSRYGSRAGSQAGSASLPSSYQGDVTAGGGGYLSAGMGSAAAFEASQAAAHYQDGHGAAASISVGVAINPMQQAYQQQQHEHQHEEQPEDVEGELEQQQQPGAGDGAHGSGSYTPPVYQ